MGDIQTNSAIDAAVNNPSLTDNSLNPSNDFRNILFDRQQRARVEKGSPNTKINLTGNYTFGKFDVMARAVYFGEVLSLNSAANNPTAIQGSTKKYFNDVALESDQTFGAKVTTDLIFTYKVLKGITLSAGANNLFDVYSDLVYVDPRNSAAAVSKNPVASAVTETKATGGYSSGRDQSNRGRFLYSANQFGYNGRYLFGRIIVDLGLLAKRK